MALLDFIKNRNAAQQQPAAKSTEQHKPETAKEMYTKQDAQRSLQNSMDRMPPEQLAKVDEIKARMEKATQHVGQDSQRPSIAESATNPQPMRQNMVNQDKAAPSMSPTSAQAGTRDVENGASVRPSPTPAKNQPGKAPQTIARRPPSWEHCCPAITRTESAG